MTVKKLIEELSKVPQEYEVEVMYFDNALCKVVELSDGQMCVDDGFAKVCLCPGDEMYEDD